MFGPDSPVPTARLVWVDPVPGDGQDRVQLDALLREVSATGVWVSAHPDTIVKMGTKDVLHRTRELGWGCDTRLYRTADELMQELPTVLSEGTPRVLKPYRGNGGIGVQKVELLALRPHATTSSCGCRAPASGTKRRRTYRCRRFSSRVRITSTPRTAAR